MWTVKFDGDQFLNRINLGFVLIILAMGLITLCIGLYKLRRSPASFSKRIILFYRRRWKLDPSVDDPTLCAALRVFTRIGSWSVIFVGGGILFIAMIWLCFAWFVAKDLRFIGVFNYGAFVTSILIPCVLFACAGRAYGIYRMRFSAKNRPAYGDLHPRRVRDYAPSWAGAAYAISFLMLLILTTVAWRFASMPLRMQYGIDHWIYLPLGRWILLVIPLLMTIFLAFGIILLRWMVALPRLKSFDEIPDVGVFDMHFRRESISHIFMTYSQVMFYTFGVQWWLILYNMPRQPVLFGIFGSTFLINSILFLAVIIGLCFDKKIGAWRGVAS